MKKHSKLDSAIILISEITKGMKSIGSKSLLQINKESTALDHQIQYIKKYYNPQQIILCTGFDHAKICNHVKKYNNIKYFFNNEYEEDNQVGTLIKCLHAYKPKNTLIITNGLLLFEKIHISQSSSTYFIDPSKDRRNQFEIGSNNLANDGYLFYGLNYKWIETLFLQESDLNFILGIKNTKHMHKLFLFELINFLQNQSNVINFVNLNNIDVNPIKINSIKDISYVKKYYKKYKYIPN